MAGQKAKELPKVRFTVTVDAEAAQKIKELAERMQATESKMASWLLEAGVEDNAWIVKLVTSRVVKGLTGALSGKRKHATGTEKG